MADVATPVGRPRAPIYGPVAGVAAARDELDALVILFCAYTGVRAAELAGLNIGDVRRGTIRVGRTRKRTGGAWIEDTPKSGQSTRRIPLPRWLGRSAHRVPGGPPPRRRPDRPAVPRPAQGRPHARPAQPGHPGRPHPQLGEPIEPSLFTRTPSSRRSGRPVCRRRSPGCSASAFMISGTRSRRWR